MWHFRTVPGISKRLSRELQSDWLANMSRGGYACTRPRRKPQSDAHISARYWLAESGGGGGGGLTAAAAKATGIGGGGSHCKFQSYFHTLHLYIRSYMSTYIGIMYTHTHARIYIYIYIISAEVTEDDPFLSLSLSLSLSPTPSPSLTIYIYISLSLLSIIIRCPLVNY
jgi:hypothetical protein